MSSENYASSPAQRHWSASKRLIVLLLVVWALVSIVAGILLVEPLNEYRVGRVPLGFWMAQQGSIYVFVVLIFFFAWRMDKVDQAFTEEEAKAKGGEKQ
jgi:putative solute:sodium symporter small subunit